MAPKFGSGSIVHAIYITLLVNGKAKLANLFQVIFSTKNMLYVTFTTLKRTAPVQNRGFFGLFEFSESFVKLGQLRTMLIGAIFMCAII